MALRNVDVARFELDRVLVAQGLDAGELVVTAGVQTLRPGPAGAATRCAGR